MALGRVRQLRLHAVQQAALVWALSGELAAERIERFVAAGRLGHEETEVARPSPAAMEQLFAEMQQRLPLTPDP